jgi:hypothetical protein
MLEFSHFRLCIQDNTGSLEFMIQPPQLMKSHVNSQFRDLSRHLGYLKLIAFQFVCQCTNLDLNIDLLLDVLRV